LVDADGEDIAMEENPWMAGTIFVLGPASLDPSAGHDDREVAG
jgi:hypothetical protein